MHPVVLLAIYASFCVVASLAGGWIPLVVRLTHRRMQIAISFVSGIILGIGVLHLVPHSLMATGSIDRTVLWLLAGFLFMFFLERFFHFHHHDVDDTAAGTDAHHDHVACAHDHEHPAIEAPFSWTGAIVGLSLHGIVDGVAMAAAVQVDVAHGLGGWPGLGAALAVILHKPFDSLTIGTLMAASGRSAAQRYLFNLVYSLITPLGILLFYLSWTGDASSGPVMGQALGFAAGAFICIASSDLLPELQFHRHDRLALSVALVAGIALAWSTVFLEEGGHDHAHQQPPDHEAHERDSDHHSHSHAPHEHE